MAEYLQNALQEHPRTRRLGELIADIAYPISSTIVGSSYLPFHSSLLSGINTIKQTSDYIFQPPYERLLSQIEEWKRLKASLEDELTTAKSEYENLKIGACPVCSQSTTSASTSAAVVDEEQRAEEQRVLLRKHEEAHERELELMRSKYEIQTSDLREYIASLNNRVDALLITLAQREYENEELRVELEGKEAALEVAMGALEEARRAHASEGRPTIETTESYERNHGILTPQSLKGDKDLTHSIEEVTEEIHFPEPTHFPLPDPDSGDEQALLNEFPVEKTTEQTAVAVPVEEEEPRDMEEIPSMDESGILVSHPDLKVSGTEADANANTVAEAEAEAEAEAKVTEKAEKDEELSSKKEDAPSAEEATASGAGIEISRRSPSPNAALAPAPVSLNDERPISGYVVGENEQILPISLTNYNQQEVGHQRSMSGSAIPVRNTSKGTVAFSSFGFGGDNGVIPHKEVPATTSPSPSSTRRKKHSFFGKHEAPHSKSSTDSNSSTNANSGSPTSPSKSTLRSRVFSSGGVHTISKKKSSDEDDESNSGSSIGHAKGKDVTAANGGSRPGTPNSFSKLTRNHSFFHDHVKVPLERKASKIVHRFNSGTNANGDEHGHGHQHQRHQSTA